MSLAIAFSAIAGYICYKHTIDLGALYTFVGVLFLSAAASAINQYQEKDLDLLMSRTKNRPLPAGLISGNSAILLSVIWLVLGIILLYFLTNPVTAILGLFNILWYNAVYTPLKRKTQFVVVIGALTGAIPPIMGWTAAGGYLFQTDILFIAAFMFLWQIPHFCLLLIRFKDDYKLAGFPSITSFVDDTKMRSIIFIWILGTSASTLFFPLFHVLNGIYIVSCLLILNAFFLLFFYRNMFGKKKVFNIRSAFSSLYLYQIIVLVILIIEAFQ
jgi:heme o synthase